jgi:hypothetical protein
VDVSTVWNYISDVDAEAKADNPTGGLIAIKDWNLLLYVHGAPHRAINAVEHHEQGVTCGIDEPTAMLGDSWVNQSAPESAEPF